MIIPEQLIAKLLQDPGTEEMARQLAGDTGGIDGPLVAAHWSTI
jgi:hypothetical protein